MTTTPANNTRIDHVRRLEPANRRILARSRGEWMLDTTDTWILFEPDRHPTLALPREDLPLQAADTGTTDDIDGEWVNLSATWNGKARVWDRPPTDLPDAGRLAVVPLPAADEWFEEDQPLTFMIRDPYRRVDVLESTREIRIHVDDVEIARSNNTRLLLETGMPPIWYVPLADLDTRNLLPSTRRTRCQYKGDAHYWHIRTSQLHQNLVWSYPDPVPAAAALAGFTAITPWSTSVRTTLDNLELDYEDPNPSWSNPSQAS